MNTNPYATPQPSPDPGTAGDRSVISIIGLASAGICGLLYALIFGLSVYEYVMAPEGYPTVSYVRHGIASGVFLALCVVAARACWFGRSYGQWLVGISPLLLIISVFPGLNTLWNLAIQLGR